MESPKIYNPAVVIGNSSDGGVPSKITCLECCNSRLFVGTFDGEIAEYFITDDDELYSCVRKNPVGKGQPIIFLRSASALDSLLVLSGGTLALYNLDTLEVKGNNNVGNVTAVAVNENPTNVDPFVVELCFSRKSSIFICHASAQGFQLVSDISVDSLALALTVDSGLVCAALAVGHYVMVNSVIGRRSTQRLCDFDARETRPKVVHVKKEEFLVLGPGSLGVFVSSSGTSERPPIVWKTKIQQIVVHNQNVVAVTADMIYVNSLLDPNYIGTIPFPGIKSVQVVEGNLYAWTSTSLYKLNTITVEEQVEALISSENFESAFSLIENAGSQKYSVLLKQAHRKAAFYFLSKANFEAAALSIKEGLLDLREILRLYEKLLPESTVYVQEIPYLHRFESISQLCGSDVDLVRRVAVFLVDFLWQLPGTNQDKDLSTSLVKLVGNYSPDSFDEILKSVTRMNLDDQNIVNYFTEQNLPLNAGALLYALNQTETSLDLYMNLLADSNDKKGVSQSASEAVARILSECADEELLWRYFYKFLKVSPEDAKQVFKLRAGVRGPSSNVVAEKLFAFPELCMDYLEFLVFDRENQDSEIHTYLASIYIDKILSSKSTSMSPTGSHSTRAKLLNLIIESTCLKHGFLVGKLQNTALRQELAIVHGKAGDHTQALVVMTRELHDHGLARMYCQKLRHPGEKKRAYLELLRIYIETFNEAEPENLISVLTDFVQEFDILTVLSMLPDGIPLSTISGVLLQAVRIVVHRRRMAEIKMALSHRIHKDAVMDEVENNFGILVQENSICDDCDQLITGIESLAFYDGLVGHEECMR